MVTLSLSHTHTLHPWSGIIRACCGFSSTMRWWHFLQNFISQFPKNYFWKVLDFFLKNADISKFDDLGKESFFPT